MTDPDVLAFWEWEPGWKLVRPLTPEALERLYFRLEPEAGYPFTDAGELQEAQQWDEEGSLWSFLLDSSDRIVFAVLSSSESSDLYKVSLIPGFYTSCRIPGWKNGARWTDGILRIYGMVLASPCLRVDRSGEPWPNSQLADSSMKSLLWLAAERWAGREQFRSRPDTEFLSPLIPHLVPGRSILSGDEVRSLLGLPPLALCSSMSVLRSAALLGGP